MAEFVINGVVIRTDDPEQISQIVDMITPKSPVEVAREALALSKPEVSVTPSHDVAEIPTNGSVMGDEDWRAEQIRKGYAHSSMVQPRKLAAEELTPDVVEPMATVTSLPAPARVPVHSDLHKIDQGMYRHTDGSLYVPYTSFEAPIYQLLRRPENQGKWFTSKQIAEFILGAMAPERKKSNLMTAVTKMAREHRGVEKRDHHHEYRLSSCGRRAAWILKERPYAALNAWRSQNYDGKVWTPGMVEK